MRHHHTAHGVHDALLRGRVWREHVRHHASEVGKVRDVGLIRVTPHASGGKRPCSSSILSTCNPRPWRTLMGPSAAACPRHPGRLAVVGDFASSSMLLEAQRWITGA